MLRSIAEGLQVYVLPGTSGEKARQQCRSAMLAIRRLADLVEQRDTVWREDVADARATLPDVLPALARLDPELAARGDTLLAAPPGEAAGAGLVWGRGGGGYLSDAIRALDAAGDDPAMATARTRLGGYTRRSLERWMAVVPLSTRIGEFSALTPGQRPPQSAVLPPAGRTATGEGL
jgi:hypothetical protein